MANGWYYLENDSRIGPVEHKEIERLISQGTVTAQTLVWREGMDGWEEAARHFGITGGVSGPPPVPPRAPNGGTRSSQGHVTGEVLNGTGTNTLYPGAPARGFADAISVCFNKYAAFSGRASRSEYWYFILFTVLVGFATGLIDMAVFGIENSLSPLNSIASLAMLLPSIAVGYRRLHDTNRSGWWLGGFYLGIIPLIGLIGIVTSQISGDASTVLLVACFAAFLIYSILLMVFLCQRGNPGANRFG
jgi:uncharacterized membrane protein YhaH (DUF805 family)